MSTQPPNNVGAEAEDQPRYGRRAEDEPGYVAPMQGGPGAAASFNNPEGVSHEGADSIPADPYASSQASGVAPSSAGGVDSGYGQPVNYQTPVSGNGQFAGYQNLPPGYGHVSGYGQAPGGAAGVPAPLNMPGRGGPIAMIVGGLVTMLIVAPIVFLVVVGLSVGSQFANTFNDGTRLDVVNGADVNVSGGFFGVVIYPSSSDARCELKGPQGTIDLPVEDNAGDDSSSVFMTQDVADGQYLLTCSNVPQGASAVAIDASMVGDFMGGFGYGFIAGSVVGIIGLGLLIWGIVRLVKVNRRRAEVQMNTLMGY